MNQKGFSKLILVIIIGAVVVIAGGIFWYYRHSAQKSSSSSKTPSVTTDVSSLSDAICANPPIDTAQMDIFESHAHISSKVSLSQIISEMDKAKVSVANIYSGTLEDSAKYPGRFITFVDTPDQPQPSTWLKQGQAFITSTEEKLKTGKYYGIGEANLRFYTGKLVPPPTVYVPADNPLWLQLVDLSAKYHVPISFHFVPDDPVANVAFEKMLSHNKDAILIWAHLGFNNMPLNSATLNDYLLRYPNLYFDTAGIQNMQQDPAPQANSNWWMLTSQADNGQLNKEWKQFFETWNSRIMFATDAGGGSNSLERWQNYTSKADGAPPDAVGHWTKLLSNLDSNVAKNILGDNARVLFLKKPRVVYDYAVTSDSKCYPVSVSSSSSVSAPTFNLSTHAITFTVAGSTGTKGNAHVTIPKKLLAGKITASVDDQGVKSESTSNSTETTISLDYAGGIKSITLSASGTP